LLLLRLLSLPLLVVVAIAVAARAQAQKSAEKLLEKTAAATPAISGTAAAAAT